MRIGITFSRPMPDRGIRYRRLIRARLPLFVEPFVELLAARGSLLGFELVRGALGLVAFDPGTPFWEGAGFVRSPLKGNGFESSFSYRRAFDCGSGSSEGSSPT